MWIKEVNLTNYANLPTFLIYQHQKKIKSILALIYKTLQKEYKKRLNKLRLCLAFGSLIYW